MTAASVRFGLVGYGRFGRLHAQAIANTEGAQLAAIAARSQETCSAAALGDPVSIYASANASRADRPGRIGRKGAFLFFLLGGFVSGVALFGGIPHAAAPVLRVALPVFGYPTLGMHAGYAICFPELFPNRVRGTGGGFCFNVGRLTAAPILVVSGWMQKDLGLGLEQSATLLSGLHLLGLVVLVFAPETKGQDLPQ